MPFTTAQSTQKELHNVVHKHEPPRLSSPAANWSQTTLGNSDLLWVLRQCLLPRAGAAWTAWTSAASSCCRNPQRQDGKHGLDLPLGANMNLKNNWILVKRNNLATMQVHLRENPSEKICCSSPLLPLSPFPENQPNSAQQEFKRRLTGRKGRTTRTVLWIRITGLPPVSGAMNSLPKSWRDRGAPDMPQTPHSWHTAPPMLEVSPRDQVGATKGLGRAQMPNGVPGRNDRGFNREMPVTQIIKSHTYEVVMLPLKSMYLLYPFSSPTSWSCVDDIEAQAEQKLHQRERKAARR